MPWTHAAVLWLALFDDPLADLHRFPPHSIASYNYLLAEASVRRQDRELCVVMDTPPICFITYNTALPIHSRERAYRIETVRMTRHCRDCWRALSHATNTRWGRASQQESLEQLRRLLGEEDWAAGQMPPPVPWWRFGER